MRLKEGESVTKASFSQKIPGPNGFIRKLCFKEQKIYNLFQTIEREERDFSGGPVVKTLGFHCRGHGFHPWLGN